MLLLTIAIAENLCLSNSNLHKYGDERQQEIHAKDSESKPY